MDKDMANADADANANANADANANANADANANANANTPNTAPPPPPTPPPTPPLLLRIVNPHWLHYDACLLTEAPLFPAASASFLAALRLFISAYMTALLLCSLFFYPAAKWYAFFSQLTNLSWIGLTLFFICASVSTCTAARRGNNPLHGNHSDKFCSEIQKMSWSKWLIWQLYILQATYQPIVVAVYWAFLSKKLLATAGTYEKFISVSMHGVGLLFILTEIALGTMQMYYSQWPIPMGVALIYVCYAQLQHLWFSPLVSTRGGYWVYPFLDTSQKYAVFWYLGLALALFVVFFLVVTIHKLRDRFIFRHHYRRKNNNTCSKV